jgi:hypothetical protein
MKARPLSLVAEDAEDLKVLSAHLQDAVARIADLVWLPKKRRFAALFNRFAWERPEGGSRSGDVRIRSGLHFDGVLAVKAKNLKRGAPEAVVSLLAISFAPKSEGDPAGTIELTFSGGGALKLEVECIDAGLKDMSGAWAARGRPVHEES